MTKITPQFAEELKQYGDDTALTCFNCGTCVAICPLVSDSFPRKLIRYIQIGAKDKILENRDELWRCLHCGLCTQSCPREADPGEVILSLKRYAVAAWRSE
jgi:heterodisulfide reductase subunit C/quinone-modifying oxidoreductase subunit QmoC